MEVQTIPIEDIYPDDNNPRQDFGDIKALAESFELNKLYPGEPVNPIVVVQDGGIYRIVDGERRYRAMKHNRVTSCHAVVCEDMDEANTQIAMLTTNDKQPLTDLEISRGVQQMLLLGVEPEKVEKTARMKAGSATKAATARALVDDAAEDMTLDRLYAIAEFADNDEAVEALSTCKENEWQALASRLHNEKAAVTAAQELRDALEEIGCTVVDTPSEGLVYRVRLNSVDEIKDYSAENDHEAVVNIGYDTAYVSVYASSQDVDPEEAAIAQLIDETEAALEAGKVRRAKWFAETLQNGSASATIEFIKSEGADDLLYQRISNFNEAAGTNYELELNDSLLINGYMKASKEPSSWLATQLIRNTNQEYYISRAVDFLDWIETLASDGYEVTEEDQRLIELCKAYILSEGE